jgi:hypothetical protein
MKVDSDGHEEWYKIFGGPSWEFLETIGGYQCTDGNYITAGTFTPTGSTQTDICIFKIDPDGNILKNTTYGGPYDEHIYGMAETIDGNYAFIIVRNAFWLSGTREDTWILLTDSDTNLEWEYIIEETGTQWSQAIAQTDDEGFIVSGRTGWKGNPSADGLILKVGPFPLLDIDISGGIGVTATITNSGAGDTTEVPYEITVTGGFLGMINKTFSGNMNFLSGTTETIKLPPFLGLGPIQVTLTVGPKEETKEGFHLLLLSLL